ncbi:hypothetical protein [Micromonospora sp. RV43]|uniref:hypothetical protein n=1 Tax=Micromonospora sp. RV43 TaxID=1661387 RepID=UPI00064BD98C|nr:hypothetical protein [Micromonospora sp. RV43]
MSPWDIPVARATSQVIVLGELRHQISEEVGPYAAGRTELFEQIDSMRLTLAMSVLAEKLPVERVRKHRREVIQTARFATWWDHWKATYQQRWWMRWRRWSVRQLVDEHEVEATAVVDLQRYWTYPRAALPVPELGEAVRVVLYEPVRETNPPPVTRFLRE